MYAFLGSKAIANRSLTRGVLRSRYTALYRDVYVPNGTKRTVCVDAEAALLWAGGSGVVAGRTAARIYVDSRSASPDPVELIGRRRQCPPGLIIRSERIAADEITAHQGLPITTPARTALDLARFLPHDEAVVVLDELARVTQLSRDDVWKLRERYPRTRGIAHAVDALADFDAGSTSQWETRVRLLLTRASMRPHTRIAVTDGFDETVIAMGWPWLKVAIDCEEPGSRKSELLQRLGWLHVTALPEHSQPWIVNRVRDALAAAHVRQRTRNDFVGVLGAHAKQP